MRKIWVFDEKFIKKDKKFVYSEKEKKKDITFIRKTQKKRGYECKNCFQFFEEMIVYEIIENEIEEKIKCETVEEYKKYSSDETKYKWICKNCCSYLEEKESI